jgi:hypothetical protein
MVELFFTQIPPMDVIQLLDQIPNKKKLKVLEVGLNNYSVYLVQLFESYTSIEPNEKIIQKFKYDCLLQKTKIPVIFNTYFDSFLIANFEKYDVIIIINTFVFFNFINLDKIFDLLNMDGYCLIQIPRKKADIKLWDKYKDMFKNAKKILELNKNLKASVKNKYFRTYLLQK